MARPIDCFVFDADNHLYETQDAFTRHLPDRYKGVIDYVNVRERTKIVVKGRISEYSGRSLPSGSPPPVWS